MVSANLATKLHLLRRRMLTRILPPVLYVIILSAALDLVPASTPKGLIAFCNIAPSFAAKVCWPYFLKGTIRYNRRVVGCCVMSMLGMIVSGGLPSHCDCISGA